MNKFERNIVVAFRIAGNKEGNKRGSEDDKRSIRRGDVI